MPTKSNPINAYLAKLPATQQSALEKLCKSIRAIIPKAEECISYAIPAFRLDGRVVAGFGASKNHCSYYPFSGRTIGTLKADLATYETTKSAIHFHPGKPLPVALVRKLINARIAEDAATRKEGRASRAADT